MALNGTDSEVEQLARIVELLTIRHYDGLPLPPEALRLHVGATPSAANYLAKGLDSSQRVLEVFGDAPTGPVLDWGCGSGRTLRWLRNYPEWRRQYRGCDVDDAAIRWLTEQRVTQVQSCSVDPPLPYEARSLQGLFGFSVLTHIRPEHHRAWYQEFHRILVPGGLAYLTYHGRTVLDSSRHPLPQTTRHEFSAQGSAFYEQVGHYKGAAFVNLDFIRDAINGKFELLSFSESQSAGQDAALLRAL